jgi:hypothetical protein
MNDEPNDTDKVEGWCFDCEAPLTAKCVDGEHLYRRAVTEGEYQAMARRAELIAERTNGHVLPENPFESELTIANQLSRAAIFRQPTPLRKSR